MTPDAFFMPVVGLLLFLLADASGAVPTMRGERRFDSAKEARRFACAYEEISFVAKTDR